MSNRRIELLHTCEPDLNKWRYVYERIKKKGIYHSPDYIKFLEKYYGDEAELFLYGNDKNFIYYPYFKRRIDTLWPEKNLSKALPTCFDIISSWYYGGPLLSQDNADKIVNEFPSVFSDFARTQNFVSEFIRFDANLQNHHLHPASEITRDRETVFIDLTKDAHAIWNDFTSANQRAIRKATEHNFELITVTNPSHEYWQCFFDIYTNEMQRKKAPEHLLFPRQFFAELRRSLMDNAILLIARKKEHVCGGFLIVFDKHTAFHYLSATLPAYWPERINNYLFYQALCWAKSKGLATFDFMGGRPGVFKFKSNFSSSRKSFYIYKKIHDKDMYDYLENVQLETSGPTPVNDRQYFPVYRAPNTGRIPYL